MPVQKYEVELSDGRKFIVETEGGPPSEQDVLASLSSQAAPAEAAPEPAPTSSGIPAVDYLSRASGPYVDAAVEGAVDIVNPMAYYRTVKGLLGLAGRAAKAGANPISLGAEFGPDVIEGVEGLKETASTPEGMGRLAGGATTAVLASRIPVGKIPSKIGKYGRETRFENVVRAVGEANAGKKAEIERLVNAGELELPVSKSAKSLREKMATKESVNQVVLKKAKADQASLHGDIDVQSAIDEMKAEIPTFKGAPTTVVTQPRTPAGLNAKKPAPVVTQVPAPEGAGNQPIQAAIQKQIDELTRVAGPKMRLKAGELQKYKEQTGSAASGAFKVAPGTGAEAAASAEAADIARKAAKNTLETSTEIPEAVRKNLTAANKREHALLAAIQPLEAQRLAKSGGNVVSRSVGGLLGRFFAGGGTSALGAVGGVETAAQFQNVLFNTLSAAGKAKLAPFLESGDLQGAIQAAFAAHIAENAARRGTNDSNQ
jgi:hypothetical protein